MLFNIKKLCIRLTAVISLPVKIFLWFKALRFWTSLMIQLCQKYTSLHELSFPRIRVDFANDFLHSKQLLWKCELAAQVPQHVFSFSALLSFAFRSFPRWSRSFTACCFFSHLAVESRCILVAWLPDSSFLRPFASDGLDIFVLKKKRLHKGSRWLVMRGTLDHAHSDARTHHWSRDDPLFVRISKNHAEEMLSFHDGYFFFPCQPFLKLNHIFPTRTLFPAHLQKTHFALQICQFFSDIFFTVFIVQTSKFEDDNDSWLKNRRSRNSLLSKGR